MERQTGPLPRILRCTARMLICLGILVACGEPTGSVDQANQPPSITITNPADNATPTDGTSVTFTGTASDPEDGNLSDSIEWVSDLDGPIDTGASVSAVLSAGEHTITASVTDSNDETRSASITLKINVPPTVAITDPSSGETLAAGTEVTLIGTASDLEDGDLSPDISWQSDLDGALGTGPSVSATLSAGEHQITASVVDSDGETQSASIQLIITPDGPEPSGTWTWMSGSSRALQTGVYGTQGSPDPGNVPGARIGSVAWTVASGNLWLFGGAGLDAAGTVDATGSTGVLNDLWRFDGTDWTWISGSSTRDQAGVYGTQGSPESGNMPGARMRSVSWIDGSGHLWLFGGIGFDAAGSSGGLNDMWRFDGTNWTWISGSSSVNRAGVYGIQGSPDPNNVPGAREGSVSWMDASGHLWLFGGYGLDAAGSAGGLNDLWRFDGTNWTWISGSSSINQPGVYGTQGAPGPGNVPGARRWSVSWIDESGNLWLFGGRSEAAGAAGRVNDLWRFDGTNWAWISGSSSANQAGVYGTQGSPAAGNVPGARERSVSWIDRSGHLWLFGGVGLDAAGSSGGLNDLWRFDGTDWTWISGSSSVNRAGVYGTQGTPDHENLPGTRGESVSWIDGSGQLWLFGGYGLDAAGGLGILNDLWRFQP